MQRYNDLNSYLRSRFGCKVYKIALSGGMTCPNRDGTKGSRGCIFCSEGGSGDFAEPACLPVSERISRAKERLRGKLGHTFESTRFIAYFQSYTNTYAPVQYLRELFGEAIADESVCALSVGTRPDCLPDDVIGLLAELNRTKPVWIELGLQTMHESTAEFIRRGYRLSVFEDAVKRLAAAGLEVIVHVILGLPGETREDMLATVKYVGDSSRSCPGGIRGIKLQLLHVLAGTDLGDMYLNSEVGAGREFDRPERTGGKLAIAESGEYIDILVNALEILPPEIVIHRLTGDAPHEKLLFPMWSANKRITLNGVVRELKLRDTRQGARCE